MPGPDVVGSSSLSIAEILAKLGTDPKTGLNPVERVRLGIVTLGIAIAAYDFWRIYGGGTHLLRGD